MRSGILNLLQNGFKVDLTREMPYHETLTVFCDVHGGGIQRLKKGNLDGS